MFFKIGLNSWNKCVTQIYHNLLCYWSVKQYNILFNIFQLLLNFYVLIENQLLFLAHSNPCVFML